MSRQPKSILLVIAALIAAAASGCLQTRSADVVNKADRLVSDAKALLETLRSIRDPASAQASISQVGDGYQKLTESLRDFQEGAKSADRQGGVTKSALEKIKAGSNEFGRLAAQITPEEERLRKIHGLPREFWMTLRKAQVKYIDEVAQLFPGEFPGEVGKFMSDISALVTKLTPERVVQIEMTGGPAVNVGEIAQKIREKLPPEGEVVHVGAQGTYTFVVGPVNDFEKFRQSLDFFEITNSEAAQMAMDVRPVPTAFAAVAARGRSMPSTPFGGVDGDVKRPEIPEVMRSHISESPERVSRSSLPDESDPDYHRKLCDLMIDDSSRIARDEAIEVLVGTNPNDITDKEVRKNIARNFRQLATDESQFHNTDVAIRGLVIYGGKYCAPMLVEMIEKERLKIEPIVFDALAAIKDPKGAEALVKLLGNFFNHEAAYHAIKNTGSVAEQALIDVAPSNDAKVSTAAVELLGEVGTEKCLPILKRAASSRNPDVKLAATVSIRKVTERQKSGEAIAADAPVDLFAAFSKPAPRRASSRRGSR